LAGGLSGPSPLAGVVGWGLLSECGGGAVCALDSLAAVTPWRACFTMARSFLRDEVL
jgi:hypothetical protein